MRALLACLWLMSGLLMSGLAIEAQAAERRCGWLQNPTPGNYWLIDREGQWVMAAQGARETPGMDRVPDMTEREWVRTNGQYGHGCACVVMDTGARGQVLRIHAVEPLPLSRCRRDRALPPP
jgi:hypothetical protein